MMLESSKDKFKFLIVIIVVINVSTITGRLPLTQAPTVYCFQSIFVPELKPLYVADSRKGKPDAKLALQIFEAQ
jgi:hypothetical protein